MKPAQWRNYFLPAQVPRLPLRTREHVAARNRAMQVLAPLLGLRFRPLRASGDVA